MNAICVITAIVWPGENKAEVLNLLELYHPRSYPKFLSNSLVQIYFLEMLLFMCLTEAKQQTLKPSVFICPEKNNLVAGYTQKGDISQKIQLANKLLAVSFLDSFWEGDR